jgi:hypothetical protein
MAIKRRVTKTITEHFDSATSYDDHGTEAAQGPSSLLEVKRKSTLGDFQDSEVNTQPESAELRDTANALSPAVFSQSARNWIAQHITRFVIVIVLLFGSVVSTVWLGGNKFGGIEKDIESLKSDIGEVQLETKESTRALQRIESILNQTDRQIRTSPKK